MRDLEPNSKKDENLPATEIARPRSSRTRTDVTSVLLELARALRGFSFYGETDPQLRPLLDRAFRALSGDLSRSGAIDVELTKTGFWIAELSENIESDGVLEPLERALQEHGLHQLHIDSDLTRTALHGFFDLLGQPADRFENPECFARALAARDSRGLRLNDIDDPQADVTPKLSATPPRASVSLASRLDSSEFESSTPDAESQRQKPTLESDPLLAPAADDRGERLRARLIELDQSSEDAAYQQRASDITVWARGLWDEELLDECYRALLVLADHAVGRGGRSESQARIAADCFAQLARGDRLDDLIRRATGSGGSGIRAAQLLLQLGSTAVPALIDRICDEKDPQRWAPLHSLVLALGEISLPTLLATIESPDDHRAIVGIRLAGEIQNPAVLPALTKVMQTANLARRVEAIRALGFLPGEESKNALNAALESDSEEIVIAATRAIETSEGRRAVPALLEVLETSLRTDRTQASRELVKVLGRLGDERAVPRLAAILDRKPMLRRGRHHAIQLSAIDALAILPTKEARRSIERAARHGAQRVRYYAQKRLEAISEED